MEALVYKKLKHKQVKCQVCPHYCLIDKDHRGVCQIRYNHHGKLIVENYERVIATHIDPIEKKPLYHFLPKTKVYSLASVGCNMRCPWCQNYQISQISSKRQLNKGSIIKPKDHIDFVKQQGIPSIAYTYTEPTMYVEYALEVMKLAHQEKINNIWVSNGFTSIETLELILPYIDAANIDYKGNESVYKSYCLGHEAEVLNTIKKMKDHNIHIEITTLLIPGINSDYEMIDEMIDNIISVAGNDIVWHISRFFPAYKEQNREITAYDDMVHAKKRAHEKGLKHVYLGNV
ncbi:MAG: AmmeMemoRadiSam system radical SAM enzyme [Candidatus Izimaplasma sp.]|nr:AmmeMemoRadiSam system radical SAM enzyme [Candidatus Izimaplasma bacterium]